jgi:hypothetical protein
MAYTSKLAKRLGSGLALTVVLVTVALGFDILVAPWAYPLFGRPTLTGHWLGTFTTPSGIHFALYLEVDRSFLTGGSSERNGELFNGHGRWCDDRGRRAENNVLSGSVPMFAGYHGTVGPVRMHLEPATPPAIGLIPANLHGQWHLDTLTLYPDLAYWTADGYQSSTANPDQNQPITVNLRKAEVDAFELACDRRQG